MRACLVLVGVVLVCGAVAPAQEPVSEPVVVSGRVLQVDGQPAAGAEIRFWRASGNSDLDFTTRSNQQGDFAAELAVERDRLANLRVAAHSADGTHVGYFRFAWDGDRTETDSVEIQLEETKPIRLRAVDGLGNPVADAHVAVQLTYPHAIADAMTDESGSGTILVPQSERVIAAVAWKDHIGLDYRLYQLTREQQADVNAVTPEFPKDGQTLTLDGASPLTVTVVDERQQPIEGVQLYPWLLGKADRSERLNLSYFTPSFSQHSDAGGKTTYHWFPSWQRTPTTIWAGAEGFVRTRGNYDPATGAGQLDLQLDRLVPIRGRVLSVERVPQPGITVNARGEGYAIDSGEDSGITDDQGRYELLVPPNQIYLVVVQDDQWAAAAQDGFAVFPGQPVDGKDFQLRKATRVYGKLTDEETGEPLPNERVIVYQYGKDLNSIKGIELPNPDNSSRYVRPMQFYNTTTNDLGEFEFALGDGNFDIRPPKQEKADEFQVAQQPELELSLTTIVQKEIETVGLVLNKSTSAMIPAATVSSIARSFRGKDWQAKSDAAGKFRVKRFKESAYVHAISDDKQLAAITELDRDETVLVLELQPVGSVRGRLLERETGKPAVGTKIRYGVRVPDEKDQTWSYRFGGILVVAEDGSFHADQLVSGREYVFNLESRNGSIPTIARVTVGPREEIELDDILTPKPRAVR